MTGISERQSPEPMQIEHSTPSKAKKKWQELFQKVKELGKGSLYDDSIILHESYWLEAMGFNERIFAVDGADTLIHLGPGYYEDHFKQWRQNEAHNMSFTEYLVQHVVKTKAEDLKTTEYKNNDAAKKCIVEFHEHIPTQGGKVLEDGKYTFVLSADGKVLYAERKVKRVKDQLRHSSFIRGAIKCAGKFIVEKGKIIELVANDSGHYRPSKKHGDYMVQFLRDESRLGGKATEDLVVNYFGEKMPTSS